LRDAGQTPRAWMPGEAPEIALARDDEVRLLISPESEFSGQRLVPL